MERTSASHSELSRFAVLKNQALYPSNKLLSDTLRFSGYATAGLTIALQNGLPKKYGVPALITAWVPEIIQSFLIDENQHWLNRVFVMQKTASNQTKRLSETQIVHKGEIIGELHASGANEIPGWKELSEFQRGKRMAFAMVDGLGELALMCYKNDPLVQQIEVFHGRSDIVKPSFLESLGFVVDRNIKDLDGKSKKGIMDIRQEIFGADSKKASVGEINDVWITKEALFRAVPMLGDYWERLMRTISPDSRHEIYTLSDEQKKINTQ